MAQSDLVVHIGGDSSDFTQNIEAAQRSITELGQRAANELSDITAQFKKTSDSPAPLMRKLRDIRKQMEQLSTSTQGQTAEGKKLYQEMSRKAKEYDAQLRQIQNDTRATSEPTQTLAGKVAEIKKQMEQLVLTNQTATEEGQKMWEELSKEAQKYNDQIQKINKDTKSVSDTSSSNSGGGLDVKNIAGDLANKAGLGDVANSLSTLTTVVNPATVAITAVGGTLIAAGKAASDFETHLDDLQALTKASDETISQMGDTAISLSKKFGIGAGEIVDSMGVIGSQAPELLATPEALADVADAAMTLGKAGSIGAEQAATAITTIINQMGVSADEAMNIANTIEAAEQEGSASVEYLNTAIEKSGTLAKQAGMSYVDLAAMIETVAPKFSSADVAGSGLNSTLLALSQAEDKFNPAIVGVTKALENLNAAHLSTAELSKIVGASNVVMVNAMMEGVDTFGEFQQKIDGTNAAVDAWKTKSDNMSGAIDRMKSVFEGFLIKLGQSDAMDSLLDVIQMVMNALGELIDALGPLLNEILHCFNGGSDEVNLFKVALDVVVDILKVVIDVVTVVKRVINNAFDAIRQKIIDCAIWIGNKWDDLKKSLQDIAFARVIINAFETMVNKIGNFIKQIKTWWNDLKKSLGMEVKADDVKTPKGTSPADRKAAEEANRKAIAEDQKARNEEAAARVAGEKKSKKGGSSSKSKTEKIDYLVSVDDNSLDTAEKKLQAWTSKKKTLNIDDKESLQKCDEEIKKWTDEVQKRKLVIENAGISLGSKADLENQLKSLEEKQKLLMKTVVDPAEMKKLIDEITSVKMKIENEEIRIGIKPKVADGSLNAIKKQIEEKEKEISLLLNTDISPDSMAKLQEDLRKLRKEEEAKEIEIGIKANTATVSKNNEFFQRGSVDDKKQSMANAQSMMSEIQQNYRLKFINKDEAQSQIDEINNALKGLGLNEIQIHFNDDGTLTTAAEDLEKFKTQMDGVSSIAGTMGNVFGSLGSAIGGTTGEIMSFTGTAISGIAQLIPQIVTMITAKNAEAIAAGTASGAELPFPANIAAIAGIIATIAGIFASLPQFANGGIVGGTSFTGDKLLARVNSGEMILNKRQQQGLYNTLSGAQIGSPNTLRGDVNFTISGSALKGTLRNYDSKMSKIK